MTQRAATRIFWFLTLTLWLPVGFLLPVLVLTLVERGLGLSEIGLVFTAYGLTTVLLELPTGGIADSFGRRPVLIVAAVLQAGMAFIWFASDSFALFAAAAMVGGILLAEPIVWLLFERGKFTQVQTLETVSVLQMYMVGLLPFGLAKLFSLFLYASHRHLKAAKIAVYSLVTSVTASLILMHPMGASGLALAGSIGGWVLFIFTVKEVGTDKFLNIVKSKYSLYFMLVMPVFVVIIYFVNQWILTLIR